MSLLYRSVLYLLLPLCIGGGFHAKVFANDEEGQGVLNPSFLRSEYLVEPLGLDTPRPRLSWVVESGERGQRQAAYQILVATSAEKIDRGVGDLWDTGKVPDDATNQIVYGGLPLQARATCYWKVRVWDSQNQPSEWSFVSTWTMGLLEKTDWKAEWINYRDDDTMKASQQEIVLQPARYYRRDFAAENGVRRATIYATVLGIYQLYLNGQEISDARFAPGWSDYKERVYYNTYDATELVRQGGNALGAIVADGWYSGYVGYGLLVGYGPEKSGRYFYGKTPALMAQLEIEYEDGTTETISTDGEWTVSTGPLLEADILMGETYDARLEMPGWNTPGFDDSEWETAIPAEENPTIKRQYFDRGGEREVNLSFEEPEELQAYPAEPIRKIDTLNPVGITEPEPGTYIFDMGQNFSGVVRLHTQGPEGTRIRLRFGEMLHQDGRLMTENLRRARATNHYVLRGDPAGEVYEPQFTYHGFQYVEVTGLSHEPDLDTIQGIVLHSDIRLTSSFECSDPMVNQLFSNMVWTQRANFFEVPTDCPQRDERLGWTGDAQIYVETAAYNADVAAFMTKWMDDLEEAQLANGAFPDYAPYPMQHGRSGKAYATGWADAGIIVPYAIYQMYGDTRVIERHYEAMRRFMDFRLRRSPDFLGVVDGNTWGDWLSIGSETPIDFIDTVYFAISAKKMSEMAEAVGKSDDAVTYSEVFANIRGMFAEKYINEEGMLTVDNQTAYVLALTTGLIPDERLPAIQKHLVKLVRDNGYRMTTGFLGTKPLMFALSDAGYGDTATRLLQSRGFPSWGYSVVNGATSIWERWNSYTKEDGFGNATMNSFSHYAFGAVGQWMFQKLAGIEPASPGFKEIRIRPHVPDADSNPDQDPIHWVNARYDSIHGPIEVAWMKQKEGGFTMKTVIPANTTAVIYIPATSAAAVTEGGQAIMTHPDLTVEGREASFVKAKTGSGRYEFEVR